MSCLYIPVNTVSLKIWILCYIDYRRVYQGLQKLLEVSDGDQDHTSPHTVQKNTKRSKKVEKLVHLVALGKEINIEG